MEESKIPNQKKSDTTQDLPKHEEKICPNCSRIFECKVGSISLCQCTKVTLSLEERDYLALQFADCLCYQCMEKLAFEYRITKSYKALTWSF
ncbi:cysteine-rich CWC [Leptospira wolbachii serovar Codice str. CDC]|uniref:Cysteine-rich CWC n=1 Tax=Leptospira wolbachii serovar Codice str. CDC TaxID=1218599 RepID=R9A6B3_9LEPT|nr:cysteine-rich CWC family protein [Leptospira wolbachii]EOQ97748.1 cysteine-rich CWC [Leptospira wolbachii serovar Codice str. CDC]